MSKQPSTTAQTKRDLTEAFWQIHCRKRMKAGYNRSTFYQRSHSW